MNQPTENQKLMDLGLNVSALSLTPGETRTNEELAEFCIAAGAHCTRQHISLIEHRAMRKIRAALYRDPTLSADLKSTLEKVLKHT